MKQGDDITDDNFDIGEKKDKLKEEIDVLKGKIEENRTNYNGSSDKEERKKDISKKIKKEKEVKFLEEYQVIVIEHAKKGGSRKKVCSSTQGQGNRRRSKRCNPKSKSVICPGGCSRRSRKGRKRNSKKRR